MQKGHDDSISETIDIELPIGNLNVFQIVSWLNNWMVNHVLIMYDSIPNKFTLQETIKQAQMILQLFFKMYTLAVWWFYWIG